MIAGNRKILPPGIASKRGTSAWNFIAPARSVSQRVEEPICVHDGIGQVLSHPPGQGQHDTGVARLSSLDATFFFLWALRHGYSDTQIVNTSGVCRQLGLTEQDPHRTRRVMTVERSDIRHPCSWDILPVQAPLSCTAAACVHGV